MIYIYQTQSLQPKTKERTERREIEKKNDTDTSKSIIFKLIHNTIQINEIGIIFG